MAALGIEPVQNQEINQSPYSMKIAYKYHVI